MAMNPNSARLSNENASSMKSIDLTCLLGITDLGSVLLAASNKHNVAFGISGEQSDIDEAMQDIQDAIDLVTCAPLEQTTSKSAPSASSDDSDNLYEASNEVPTQDLFDTGPGEDVFVNNKGQLGVKQLRIFEEETSLIDGSPIKQNPITDFELAKHLKSSFAEMSDLHLNFIRAEGAYSMQLDMDPGLLKYMEKFCFPGMMARFRCDIRYESDMCRILVKWPNGPQASQLSELELALCRQIKHCREQITNATIDLRGLTRERVMEVTSAYDEKAHFEVGICLMHAYSYASVLFNIKDRIQLAKQVMIPAVSKQMGSPENRIVRIPDDEMQQQLDVEVNDLFHNHANDIAVSEQRSSVVAVDSDSRVSATTENYSDSDSASLQANKVKVAHVAKIDKEGKESTSEERMFENVDDKAVKYFMKTRKKQMEESEKIIILRNHFGLLNVKPLSSNDADINDIRLKVRRELDDLSKSLKSENIDVRNVTGEDRNRIMKSYDHDCMVTPIGSNTWQVVAMPVILDNIKEDVATFGTNVGDSPAAAINPSNSAEPLADRATRVMDNIGESAASNSLVNNWPKPSTGAIPKVRNNLPNGREESYMAKSSDTDTGLREREWKRDKRELGQSAASKIMLQIGSLNSFRVSVVAEKTPTGFSDLTKYGVVISCNDTLSPVGRYAMDIKNAFGDDIEKECSTYLKNYGSLKHGDVLVHMVPNRNTLQYGWVIEVNIPQGQERFSNTVKSAFNTILEQANMYNMPGVVFTPIVDLNTSPAYAPIVGTVLNAYQKSLREDEGEFSVKDVIFLDDNDTLAARLALTLKSKLKFTPDVGGAGIGPKAGAPRFEPLQFVYRGVSVSVQQGDIVDQTVDVIVNPANEGLIHAGGAAAAIQNAAGPVLHNQCRDYIRDHGRVPTTENMVTGAGNLSPHVQAVIHAVGPVWHDNQAAPCSNMLFDTVLNVLRRVQVNRYRSIAIPAISSGLYGMPKEVCASVMYDALMHHIDGAMYAATFGRNLSVLQDVRFVNLDIQTCLVFKKTFLALRNKPRRPEVGNIGPAINAGGGRNAEGNQSSVGGRAPTMGGVWRARDSGREQNWAMGRGERAPIMGSPTLGAPAGNLPTVRGNQLARGDNGQQKKQYQNNLRPAGNKKKWKKQKNVKASSNNQGSNNVALMVADGGRRGSGSVRSGESGSAVGSEAEDMYDTASDSDSVQAGPAAAAAASNTTNYQGECSFCTEPFTTDNTQLGKFSCQHLFCLDCFISDAATCPVATCNAAILEEFANKKSFKAIIKQLMVDGEHALSNLAKSIQPTDFRRSSSNEGGEDPCAICLGQIKNRTVLEKCKHAFCKQCIDTALASRQACPVCKRPVGKITGKQPRGGKMIWRKDATPLPGYGGCGTIVITYDIHDGIQGPEHPNPGHPYQGTHRVAYLPDNTDGNEILMLLKQAFDQRLIFTVGQSASTGRDNVVTWNDIHHKTSRTGGEQQYGYPDKYYLLRVREELRMQHIV